MSKIVKIRLQLVNDRCLTKDGVYGTLSETRDFILNNVGNVFDAVRIGMNYYELASGRHVHIYNAYEIKEEPKMEYPTAAEMRKKSKSVVINDDKNHLKEITNSIIIQSNCGKCVTYFYTRVSDRVLSQLKELGYICKVSDCQLDGYCLSVFW